MKRLRAASFVGLALAATVYVAGNLLFNLSVRGARLDVTEEALFTLSAGTHATLARIDEPIDLHLFFSPRLGRDLPYYENFARRVRELLAEIVAAANGKILFHLHDPEPFSRAEDLAVAMGVQGIPLRQGGELAYFGLAGVNSVDEVRTVAFFQPDRESLLEYELVELIHALSVAQPIRLGVISSMPLLGDMDARLRGQVSTQWSIAKPLTTGFEVINLPQAFDDLPAELDVLMIVHPTKLGARERYEIEQFLFRGGRVVAFLDPKSEAPSAVTSVAPSEASSSSAGLDPLLRNWGITVSDGKLVGDRSLAREVNAGTTQQVRLVDHMVWLAIPHEHLSQTDPVTAHLPLINVASAGYIERRLDSPLKLEPLIATSKNSALVPVEAVAGLRPDIAALEQRFTSDPLDYVIAARLSGRATTAFPDGPPARTIAHDASERAQRAHSDGDIKLILVADSDLLRDRLWIRTQQLFGRDVSRQFASNAAFVVNAIENLGGSDDLIALRSRGVSRRPFERVNALRQQAAAVLNQREQALKQKLTATQEKIASLEGVRSTPNPSTGEIDVKVALTPEQRAEVEVLRHDMLSIRAELRAVQRGLQEDVEALEVRLELLNIVVVPVLVAAVAGMLAMLRLRRRRVRDA